MVIEKMISFYFSRYKSIGAIDPLGQACLDLRGLNDRIYVKGTKYCYILNIYAVGLMASEKKIFLSFPHYNSMRAICCHLHLTKLAN